MPPKLRVVVNRRPGANPRLRPLPRNRTRRVGLTPSTKTTKRRQTPSVGADVYIGTDFTKEMGAAANSLKAILIAAAGYDRIDPDAVPEGCIVANAYHHEAPIAEWVMSVAVALDHELFKSDRTFRAGSWEMWPGRHGVYRELMDRTFGIVGFGAIGRRVARLAQAYEMPVIAAGRADTANGELYGANYIGGGKHAREHLLSESDFVLISTPLGPATHGLIGERELSLMKPTAYIINPARGHIIDEASHSITPSKTAPSPAQPSTPGTNTPNQLPTHPDPPLTPSGNSTTSSWSPTIPAPPTAQHPAEPKP